MNMFFNIVDFMQCLGIVYIALDKIDDSPKGIKLSLRDYFIKIQLVITSIVFFSQAVKIIGADFQYAIGLGTVITHGLVLLLAREYFYSQHLGPKWKKEVSECSAQFTENLMQTLPIGLGNPRVKVKDKKSPHSLTKKSETESTGKVN
ncbi:MAG: hypothetical protein WC967_09210 [Balneolaceae bacterium]